jgi:hypothetical protein
MSSSIKRDSNFDLNKFFETHLSTLQLEKNDLINVISIFGCGFKGKSYDLKYINKLMEQITPMIDDLNDNKLVNLIYTRSDLRYYSKEVQGKIG